jgi:hypothetical protein
MLSSVCHTTSQVIYFQYRICLYGSSDEHVRKAGKECVNRWHLRGNGMIIYEMVLTLAMDLMVKKKSACGTMLQAQGSRVLDRMCYIKFSNLTYPCGRTKPTVLLSVQQK